MVKRNKYSINSIAWNEVSAPDNSSSEDNSTSDTIIDANLVLVPSSEVGGARKVKNFSINMTTYMHETIFWAVVYVPEGTSPHNLSGEGYQPNNYVIAQGMLTDQIPVKVKSRLSRNLNQNDTIQILFKISSRSGVIPVPLRISGFIQYAICYN